MALIAVLCETRSAECMLVTACFVVLHFHYCSTCFLLCLVQFINTVLILHLTVLHSCWTNRPPQDPIIWPSEAQRTEGWIVRALWSTPSDAALVASYLGAHFNSNLLSSSWVLSISLFINCRMALVLLDASMTFLSLSLSLFFFASCNTVLYIFIYIYIYFYII